jgi:glycolate oxidase iron-sulfur subunit
VSDRPPGEAPRAPHVPPPRHPVAAGGGLGALLPLLDACVHCGLCLPACPTYGATGNELDSPRGRLDLVRGLVEGAAAGASVAAHHLDRCLGCRACETACPSGVAYGQVLETARAELLPRGGATPGALALRTFASPTATRWALRGAWLARRTGLLTIGRRLPGALGRAARLAPDARWTPWSETVPGVLPATSQERRGAVALLPGCVMDQGFADVHEAAATCLRAAGFDVHVPRGPLCCGALHAHVGERAAAGACASRLADALPRDVDALIVDAAGCGSHLKETPGPWPGRTFDVLEFLDAQGLRAPRHPVAARYGARPGTRLRVVYADPCHLAHGQGVRDAPRRLLASIPDVLVVPLRDADRCCGSAGIYNLAQPALADELLRQKVTALREADPDVIATANPGCHLQIAAGLRAEGHDVPVVHVVELLATALVA